MKLICISTKVYVNPNDEVELYSQNKQWKYLTINKEYECIDIFPTSISPIDLSYDSSGAIEEFTVEFQVQSINVAGAGGANA
jgi:hypothetical protein